MASQKLANQKNSNFDPISKCVNKNVHFALKPLLTTVIKPKAIINETLTVENELFEYVFGDEFNDLQLLKYIDDELELLAKEISENIEKIMV